MRKGKFRGKAICDYEQFGIKRNEWVYGYYYKDVEETDDEQSFKYVSYIRISYGDHYVDIEVIPETIGEYIGLKDINGKDIYKNDIVTIFDIDVFTGIVIYDLEECGFKATNGEKDYGNNFSYLGSIIEEIEVIGDIYGNIELLKEDK